MNQETNTDYPDDPCLRKMQLAQAYFLFQKYDGIFPPAEALCEGTLFPAFLGPKRWADPPEEGRVVKEDE